MSEFLTDVTIKSVFRGKSGESQYGPWQAWNFYCQGHPKLKFSYFSGGDKPEPEEGMVLKLIEYDIVQKGQFTNFNVSKLVPAGNRMGPRAEEPGRDPDGVPEWVTEDIPPPQEKDADIKRESNSTKLDGSISFYVAYAKAVAVALIETGKWNEAYDLDEICGRITDAGIKMYWKVNK